MRTRYYIQMMCLMGLLLAGCSDAQEDIEQVIGDEGCRVSIRVGASDNVETKAGNDDNALEHEFINELCVFVVDDQGTIEQKFQASSTDENGTFTGEPSTGDAYEWRSSEFDLPAGKKTIYAFANWSTASNDSWNAIIGKSVGGTLSDAELKITIDNPAGKVDLANGKYIPMSVKQEVNVTVDQTIRVELVRLVGRVDIQLKNDKISPVSVTSFTMEQFADKVALMPEGTAAGVEFNQSYSTSFESLTIGGGQSETFQFYVNETENSTSFSIQLTADNKNYSAKTTAMAIPRNYILPLNLTLREGDLSLIVMVYIAPIGVYPVPIYTSIDLLNENEFAVKVPEGCSFQAIAKVGENETPGVCEFSHPEGATNANIQIDGNDPSWAYVTALSGLSEQYLNVSVIGTGYTCKLKISTVPLEDWTSYPISSSLRQWQAAPAWYEVVPLRMANPE